MGPLISVAGSCCQSCAEAAARVDARTMALYGRPIIQARMLESVGEIAEKARPWSDAEKFESDSRQFEQEVKDALARWREGEGPGEDMSEHRIAFIQEFTNYLAQEWRPWFKAGEDKRAGLTLEGALTFNAVRDDELGQFTKLERDFAAFIRRWTESLGEKTSIAPPDGKSPLESLMSSIAHPPKWVVVTVLAGIAVIFLGPSLLSVLGALAARKAVATATGAAIL